MYSRSKRPTLLLLAALLGVFAGAACNTIHGAGKDIDKLGDKIQDKSR